MHLQETQKFERSAVQMKIVNVIHLRPVGAEEVRL